MGNPSGGMEPFGTSDPMWGQWREMNRAFDQMIEKSLAEARSSGDSARSPYPEQNEEDQQDEKEEKQDRRSRKR